MTRPARVYLTMAMSLSACSSGGGDTADSTGGSNSGAVGNGTARGDGATQIAVSSLGSQQNPAWSPDGLNLLFTRWVNGYNAQPADLLIVTLAGLSLRTLVSDGSANVNLPGSGSTWNGTTRKIVFTSSRVPHDEAWMIGENGPNGSETQITSRPDKAVFEASLSPDGQTIVFESHGIDVEDNGVIFTYKVDGSGPYTALTDSATDSRQPVWSPAGDKIVFQRRAGEQWDIWTMNTDGSGQTKVTNSAAFDETDPSFSPDGSRIVYSSNEMGGAGIANIFIVPAAGGASTRVTNFSGYDGAPSWSPDGATIAFESSPGDPDGSAGTTLWVIAAPTGAAVRPPALSSTWQWQLLVDQQHPLNTSYDVDVYDVDMENTSTQQIVPYKLRARVRLASARSSASCAC